MNVASPYVTYGVPGPSSMSAVITGIFEAFDLHLNLVQAAPNCESQNVAAAIERQWYFLHFAR